MNEAMSTEGTVERSNPLDTPLLLAAIAVICGSIWAFYEFASVSALLRVLGLMAGVAVALALVYQTGYGRSAWLAIQGSRIELKRVVWPTRKEAVQATLMIMVVVLVLSLFMWGLDALLLWAVKLLTGRGGE